MTLKIDSEPVNAISAAILTTKKFLFGKRTSTGVNVCTVLGERADGVIGAHYRNTPVAGDGVDFYIDRMPVVIGGDTFSAGAKLTTAASGKAVPATDGHHVNAIAVDACTADGELVRIQFPSAAVPASGVDAIVAVSAPGAIPPTASHALLSVDGTDAFTLAAGEEGHVITIECISALNTPLGTVTIADTYGTELTTPCFTAAGQKRKMIMTSTGWKTIDKTRAGTQAVVVGTTVLTNFDMADTYDLSVTGTVTSDSTKGIPDGLVPDEEIDVQVSTAATCPVGVINITACDADGTAKKDIASIDGTTSHNAHFRWNGAKWRNTSLTGLTLTNA